METLKEAIYRLETFGVVKDLVLQLNQEEVEKNDHEGLDLLQHAILANYGEVVQLLLTKGTFNHPSLPKKGPPYLHLACLLGHAQTAYTLLEFRRGDFITKVVPETWLYLEKTTDILTGLSYVGKGLTNIPLQIVKAEESLLAVDVAASAGHVKCVQMLLNSNYSPCTSRSALERAVEVNSPRALALLLTQQANTPGILQDAFRAAVRRKLPDCLQLLLQHGVDALKTFNGMNPYHVMYMYSTAYRALGATCRSEGLAPSTLVLVSGKMEINSREPVGSYPLYSLLHMMVYEKDSNPNQVPLQHIKALEILLAAGADANFDEVAYAEKRCVSPNAMTVGRDLFTSALNALFASLQTSDTWRDFMACQLDYCCDLLLHHGADPRYVDSYGETPLHDLMKVWAMQHTMGHMHVNLGHMAELLLKHGANPNLQSTNGLYPVHHYFTILCNLMGGLIAFRRWLAAGNISYVLGLLRFMDQEKALEAAEQILACCKEVMPDDMLAMVKVSMMAAVAEVKSLQLLCGLTVWKAVDRRAAKLEGLHIPTRLIQNIQNMFHIV